MSWRTVARKDFEDVVRSRMVWSILAVFVLLMTIVVLGASSNSGQDVGLADVVNFFSTLGGELLVPLTALVVGYMAIAGERESGSLRILFGLSHGRRDVLVGKATSRVTTMVVVATVACVSAAVLSLAVFGSMPADVFVGFLVLTVGLAAAFTGIALGVSAVTGSRRGAMGGAVGSYVFFTILWNPFVAGLHYAVEGELVGIDAPAWYLFLQRLSPLEAYRQGLMELLGENVFGLFGWEFIVEDVDQEAMADGGLVVSNRVGGEAPFYLTEWFAVLILLAWLVVPLALGLRHFEAADLN